MAVRVHLKALEVSYHAEAGATPRETVVTIEGAEHYVTQATSGAGLVCDVYENQATTRPKATFANVLYAEIVSDEIFILRLSEDELTALRDALVHYVVLPAEAEVSQESLNALTSVTRLVELVYLDRPGG